MCSLVGRWSDAKIFIRHHEADPVWSVAVLRFSYLIGHGSRYVKITFKQSTENDGRGRPKLVGTMEDLKGGLALRRN